MTHTYILNTFMVVMIIGVIASISMMTLLLVEMSKLISVYTNLLEILELFY